MAGYIPRWYTRPKTVTHPGSNRARRALTSFMRRTPLTTAPRRCAGVSAEHSAGQAVRSVRQQQLRHERRHDDARQAGRHQLAPVRHGQRPALRTVRRRRLPHSAGTPTPRYIPAARFTKYLTIYRKIVVRSTYDSDLRRAKTSFRNIVSYFTNTILDDLTILQVNWTEENPCVLRKMFCKLNVRRKSILTLALSQDNRKIVVRYFVNRAPGLSSRVVSASDYGVRGPGSNHTADGCVHRDSCCNIQPRARASHLYCSA